MLVKSQLRVQGERTIKTRVYSSNGQEIDRQELSNEETLAPVTQVVKVGTHKPAWYRTMHRNQKLYQSIRWLILDEIRVEKVAFNTEEQYTDELVRDARQIATRVSKVNGRLKLVSASSNGREIDRQELSNEETLAPVTQIVKVGMAKPNMVPNDAPKAEALEEFDLISLHNLFWQKQIRLKLRHVILTIVWVINWSYDTALMVGQAILSQSQASQAEVNQLVEQINQAKAQLSGLEVVKRLFKTSTI